MLSSLRYAVGLPFKWAYQMAHNAHGIARVLDITKFRRLPAGLVGLDHPWVTGVNPDTGRFVWPDNVIYRTPRPANRDDLASDELVLEANGKFLARRVRQSAVTPELPVGPRRRMPHGINYIHGSSHYNSGVLIFTDFAECYRHITDPAFRKELWRFVRRENREVLFLFRDREYSPREYAYLSCCMRSVFPWFCNPNGPKQTVLWGNAGPFPAANMITGRWVRDVYALKKPGGAEKVIRPAIAPDAYFQHGPYDGGRSGAIWIEKLLAWATYWRVRARGRKAGLFFVDRRKVYADRLQNRAGNRAPKGAPDRPLARM